MITRLFTAHPSSVDETYLEHSGFAFRFAGWLALAAMAAVVHAIFPWMFEKTASQIIAKLHNRTVNRSDPALKSA